MPRKILSLDIDGVLTTKMSRRRDYWCFGTSALRAFQHLLQEGQPDLCVVHSSWRKLPKAPPTQLEDTWWMYGDGGFPVWSHDLWRSICHRQNLNWQVPLVDAPYKLTTHRGHEVGMWLAEHEQSDDRIVVLDDEAWLLQRQPWSKRPHVRVFETDDRHGLTQSQAAEAVRFWLDAG